MSAQVFLTLLILAAAGDVMTRRIPNPLVAILGLAFIPFALVAGFPTWMFLEHACTAIVLLVSGYALFSFGLLGAGDAKMMAVVGLWLGFAPTVLFVLFSALAGGFLAAWIGMWFMVRVEAGLRSTTAEGLLNSLKPDVPYGFALAAGAILAIPYSWLSIVKAVN